LQPDPARQAAGHEFPAWTSAQHLRTSGQELQSFVKKVPLKYLLVTNSLLPASQGVFCFDTNSSADFSENLQFCSPLSLRHALDAHTGPCT
jgi:hypothetical protein